MKSLLAVSTIAIAIAIGAASVSVAQPSQEAMQAVRAACAADYAKLCPDAKTRDDRRQCMMTNQDKFSNTCKAAIASMRAKMQAAPAPGSSR
jgi:hypothetical protein